MEHMDRLTNHAISGVRKTYNRFDFASKDREIMEWLGSHIVGLAEGRPAENVVQFGKQVRT